MTQVFVVFFMFSCALCLIFNGNIIDFIETIRVHKTTNNMLNRIDTKIIKLIANVDNVKEN